MTTEVRPTSIDGLYELANQAICVHRGTFQACKAYVLFKGDIHDFGFLMNAPNKTERLLIQTVAGFLNRIKPNFLRDSALDINPLP